ncbi:carboxypeptidase regulatory-like domain-containing protein, partial [Chloroflexota bacterium]
MKRRVVGILVVAIALGGVAGQALFIWFRPAEQATSISGIVRDDTGPVAGATVRIQATTNQTLTDDEGRFTLIDLREGVAVTVSAWKHTYYSAKVEGVVPPTDGIALDLRLYQANDNPDYEWILPIGANSCASCKGGVTQIWLGNTHAGSGTNPRFLSMYNGTDLSGVHRSPETRYGSHRDYGRFPLRPDPNQPYYGPGFKLDFPEQAGNCAACHTPGAAVDAPYDTDPNALTGANVFGVHCDLCHKVADIHLNPATGLPFPNMSGVLSMDVRRPFPDDPDRYQLFFGTFDDDNVPEEDTYLALIKTSQFCAPCHFGIFWDTVIYNSFGEWLESPYSDPAFERARTCQNCHMPSPSILGGKPITNVAPTQGGVERDPISIHAHTQPGAAVVELLQDTAKLELGAHREEDLIFAEVRVTNENAG